MSMMMTVPTETDTLRHSSLDEKEKNFLRTTLNETIIFEEKLTEIRAILDNVEPYRYLNTFKALADGALHEAKYFKIWAENCCRLDYMPHTKGETDAIMRKLQEILFYVREYVDTCDITVSEGEFLKAARVMMSLHARIVIVEINIQKEIEALHS